MIVILLWKSNIYTERLPFNLSEEEQNIYILQLFILDNKAGFQFCTLTQIYVT